MAITEPQPTQPPHQKPPVVQEFFRLATPPFLWYSIFFGAFYLYVIRQEDLILESAITLILLYSLTLLMATLWSRYRLPSFLEESNTVQLDSQTHTLTRSGWTMDHPPLFLTRLSCQWLTPVDTEALLESLDNGLLLQEKIALPRRCLYNSITKRFEISDILGLHRASYIQDFTGHIHCLPETKSVTNPQVLQALRSGDGFSHPKGEPLGDLMEVRNYFPGDPPNRILWKLVAKTRKVMVRSPERAIVPEQKICLYLTSGTGDENTAGLARYLIEEPILSGEVYFAADGTPNPTSDKQLALDALARSGNHDLLNQSDIDTFFNYCSQAGFSDVMVLVPTLKGGWESSFLEALPEYTNYNLQFIIGSYRPPEIEPIPVIPQATSWFKNIPKQKAQAATTHEQLSTLGPTWYYDAEQQQLYPYSKGQKS